MKRATVTEAQPVLTEVENITLKPLQRYDLDAFQ